MPASNRSSARTQSQPAILLIEEYDALAAAINSALKKFAPHHVTRVARSLEDAEILASKNRLDLFIIDFDPSFAGLTAFLQKMRKAHSASRVLIIATGVSREIVAERRPFGALQFIGKPYDVADFGACVQALLGPWNTVASAGARGTLSSLTLADIVTLQCAGGRTAVVDVKGSGGDAGAVHILDGHIFHAEADGQTGVKALETMLTWATPRMRETAKRISKPRTIHGPWAAVFLEAWRNAMPAEEAPAKTRAKTGKKIVIIDDTDMLLVFVEDVLATADPELQITKALTGTDGLKQIESVLPDLVLLDYSLPDFNGDEVCRRLLANDRTARIPVLMMSGHVAEMNAAAERFQNIVETIEKPFLSDAFVDLVQRTLTEGPKPEQKRAVTPAPSISEPAQKQPQPIRPAEMPAIATPIVPPPGAPRQVEKTPRTIAPPSPPAPLSTPVRPMGEHDVVLGLFVEVLSMQLTPELRMGTIRARPASSTVSLHFSSAAVRDSIPAHIGFQLGAAELDGNGRLSAVRVTPTTKPFQPAEMRSAFEIGGVTLVPGENRTRVQLTPSGTTPMTMELCANLELSGVVLSSTFQVAHLMLSWRNSAVRITLDPKAPAPSGAGFNVAVKLDNVGRIAELVLNPAKSV